MTKQEITGKAVIGTLMIGLPALIILSELGTINFSLQGFSSIIDKIGVLQRFIFTLVKYTSYIIEAFIAWYAYQKYRETGQKIFLYLAIGAGFVFLAIVYRAGINLLLPNLPDPGNPFQNQSQGVLKFALSFPVLIIRDIIIPYLYLAGVMNFETGIQDTKQTNPKEYRIALLAALIINLPIVFTLVGNLHNSFPLGGGLSNIDKVGLIQNLFVSLSFIGNYVITNLLAWHAYKMYRVTKEKIFFFLALGAAFIIFTLFLTYTLTQILLLFTNPSNWLTNFFMYIPLDIIRSLVIPYLTFKAIRDFKAKEVFK